VILHIAHEKTTSSDGCHQGWEVQVQDKHLEKIICLKLVIHLVIMELWRHALVKLSHSGVWGRKLEVFTKQQWSSDAFRLDGSMKHLIKVKRDAQGKGLSLLGFPFTGLKVFVGRPSYRIDSRTMKRGFRLGNLITSCNTPENYRVVLTWTRELTSVDFFNPKLYKKSKKSFVSLSWSKLSTELFNSEFQKTV
jgi:hypothetical protein